MGQEFIRLESTLMVDFRYHLVSLIAVFMALAVGIILGAGPLQNSIGNALSDQVESLRTSRDDAREDVERLEGNVESYQAGLEGMTPGLVDSSLANVNVALVVLPGADSADIDRATKAVTDAGATMVGTVSLTSVAVSADDAERRTTVSESLGEDVAATDVNDRLGEALALVLTEGPNVSENIVTALTQSDAPFMEINDAFQGPARAFVVVGPAEVELDDNGVPTGEVNAEQAATLLTATGDIPAVYVGSTGTGTITEYVRSGEISLSTVDSPEDPTAMINIPFALTQEFAGATVAWGMADDATAVLGNVAPIVGDAINVDDPDGDANESSTDTTDGQ